jgi:hypothetical protein
MTLTKVEQSIKFGYLHAPFGSAGNYQSFKALFKEMYQTFDHTWELFKLVYPFICDAWYGSNVPPDYFSEDHLKEVWHELPSSRMLKRLARCRSTTVGGVGI